MTDKAYDEKGAWNLFKKKAPAIGQLVDGKLGKGSAADRRRQLEKPPISKDDGRRQRATGRSKVFNTKLKPEFRDELFALAAERNIGVAELLEQIVTEWKALRGAQK